MRKKSKKHMSTHRKKKEKINNNKKEETSKKRHTKIKTTKMPKTSRMFLLGYIFLKVTRRFAHCFLYYNLPNLGRLSFGELEEKTPRLNQFSLSSLLPTKQLL